MEHMMADRKEVLDYLRNQQKAAEIEAKMNGVNVWVLLGAIAVVAWQLTSVPSARLWNDQELTARTLVSALALHMLSSFFGRSSGERDELRYSRTNLSEMESPFLVLLQGVLIFLPPAALWVLTGKGVGVVVLSFLGLLFIVLSAIAVLKPLFSVSQERGRFPKPEFGLTKRANVAGTLVFGVLFLVALGEQINHFLSVQSGMPIDEAKAIVLLAVLYLLALITVGRKQQNDSIAWTYDMETDLILGTITPEVAIRKIENRRLGPRLQDVVDRFLDDLDQRFAEVDSKLLECTEKINAAKEVPEQYPAERAARLKSASEDVATRIDSLAADCKEFRDYLAKLEQNPGGGRKSVLAPILTSLKARHDAYDERVRTARLQLKRLLS
jgi:hypothetical protein